MKLDSTSSHCTCFAFKSKANVWRENKNKLFKVGDSFIEHGHAFHINNVSALYGQITRLWCILLNQACAYIAHEMGI